jgi:hypothetical protein
VGNPTSFRQDCGGPQALTATGADALGFSHGIDLAFCGKVTCFVGEKGGGKSHCSKCSWSAAGCT